MRIALEDILSKLPLPPTEKWPEGVWDIEAFRKGSMSLTLFTPRGKDYQSPHKQDEVYIVLKGTGIFRVEAETYSFSAGDVLFVPAGKAHCFERFSPDIATWVVFWGPEGGEKP
jgi:mannose-6-phosphate isomerase-like protein (cupin superfamily)